MISDGILTISAQCYLFYRLYHKKKSTFNRHVLNSHPLKVILLKSTLVSPLDKRINQV